MKLLQAVAPRVTEESRSKNSKRRAVRFLRVESTRIEELLKAFKIVEEHIIATDSVRRVDALDHVTGYTNALHIDLAQVFEVGTSLARELGKTFAWSNQCASRIEDPDEVAECAGCEEQGPAWSYLEGTLPGDLWHCKRCDARNSCIRPANAVHE